MAKPIEALRRYVISRVKVHEGELARSESMPLDYASRQRSILRVQNLIEKWSSWQDALDALIERANR